MSRKYKSKLPPFVAMFRHTLKSQAWKAASVGARALFLALQSNHNTNSQNAVFMSARKGAEELGANKDTVGKWHRELEHYGFIVKVRGAHLGSDGCGKAALYRLTDRWYAGEAPTYDFEKWSGDMFDEKQNPVRNEGTPCPLEPDIRTNPKKGLNGQKCPAGSDIRTASECPLEPDVTSFTRSLSDSEARLCDEWGVELPEGYQALAPCDEADDQAWVDAWLEEVPNEYHNWPPAPVPTLSLAEIRQSMGYRQ